MVLPSHQPLRKTRRKILISLFYHEPLEVTNDSLEYIAGSLATKFHHTLAHLGDFSHKTPAEHLYNMILY